MKKSPTFLQVAAVIALLATGLGTVSGQVADNDTPAVKGYISIEAYSIREELVVRLDVVEKWLGIETTAGIPADAAKEITDAFGAWLKGKNKITINGKPITTTLEQVNFVRPDPEKGLVVDDRDLIPSGTAMIGTVFAASLEGLPAKASIEWNTFPEDEPAIVEIGTRRDRSGRELTPENNRIDWVSDGKEEVGEFLPVPEIESNASNTPLIGSIFFTLLIAVGYFVKKMRWVAVPAGILGLIAVQVITIAPTIEITEDDADEIAYALLRNTYHSFDYRDESAIYDALDRSVEGDLLEQIYLEVTKSLQLESQGGARVRIIDLDLREATLGEVRPHDFDVRCEWVAIGEITHWGHTHKRVNKYTADATIKSLANQWKFSSLALANEERL